MDIEDYYRPPKADLQASEGAVAVADRKLYSVQQITAGTFLGSPMAGALLLAANFRALGQPRQGRNTVLVGIGATIALLALAFLLPDRFPNYVLPLAYTLGMRAAVNQMLGSALAAHFGAGGGRGSNWRVAGIALACLGGLMAAVLVAAIVAGPE
jgi:hypothetical protein